MSEQETATAEEEAVTETHEIDPEEFKRLKESNEKMQAKLDELLGETKAERDKRRQAEEQAAKQAEESARKAGDIEALEKSWSEKLTAREKELQAELEARDSWVKDLTVGQTATTLAAELAVQGSAKALLPHIRARLGTDVRDGKPVTVVLDENGKPSAMTVDELKKEIANDPAFAPLIVGTRASGAGGVGGKGGAHGKKPEEMSAQERNALLKENPEEFYKLFPQAKLR